MRNFRIICNTCGGEAKARTEKRHLDSDTITEGIRFSCSCRASEYAEEKVEVLPKASESTEPSQAERVELQLLCEELEKVKGERDAYYRNMNYWNDEHSKETERGDRFRSQLAEKDNVLEWYADQTNYSPPKPFVKPFIEVDKGVVARTVLSKYQGRE